MLQCPNTRTGFAASTFARPLPFPTHFPLRVTVFERQLLNTEHSERSKNVIANDIHGQGWMTRRAQTTHQLATVHRSSDLEFMM